MINNTYLSIKCCICNNSKMKKFQDIFWLCSLCNKNFCDNSKCLSNHKCSKDNYKFIKINELKKYV